jgi:AraC-like DNA-binding protein
LPRSLPNPSSKCPLRIGDVAIDPASLLGIFDSLPQILTWIKDCTGGFIWANEPFLFNFSIPTLAQLRGLRDSDMVAAYLAEQYRQDDEAVLAGAPVFNRIEPISGWDQATKLQRTTKLPLRSNDGQIIGIIGLTQPLPKPTEPEFPIREFLPIFEAFLKTPENALTNAQMAKLAAISVRAFERRFQQHFQLSPQQFFRRLRITKAAAALIHTQTPISQISLQWGFSDQSHFNREFRKCYQATPAHFRKEHRVP